MYYYLFIRARNDSYLHEGLLSITGANLFYTAPEAKGNIHKLKFQEADSGFLLSMNLLFSTRMGASYHVK